jgi:drug/metabolite transporter (DMT)-like permease
MLSGWALLLLVALLTGAPAFAGAELAWAVVAGLVGVAALGCLYAAMAIGMISIVGPISACGVVIPVVIGLARGDQPSTPQAAGMVVAAAGVVLASVERDDGDRGVRLVAGLGLALVAAAGFGLWFATIDLASAHDPYWASVVAQAASALLALLLVVVHPALHAVADGGPTAPAAVPRSRPPLGVTPWLLLLAATSGLSDAIGVLTFAMSTGHGFLSIVSVIAALYPAFLVGFAALFLHERPSRHQFAGVVLALVGIALITAGGS